jgi:hypothetical protein
MKRNTFWRNLKIESSLHTITSLFLSLSTLIFLLLLVDNLLKGLMLSKGFQSTFIMISPQWFKKHIVSIIYQTEMNGGLREKKRTTYNSYAKNISLSFSLSLSLSFLFAFKSGGESSF